jgi:hypothetical protein
MDEAHDDGRADISRWLIEPQEVFAPLAVPGTTA